MHSIANLYLENSDTLLAVEKFNQSIAMQPLQQYPYLSLFYIYLAKNDLNTANSIIKKCHELNHGDLETIYWKGMTEKYLFKNSVIGDSLLSIFESNPDVQRSKKIFDLSLEGSKLRLINIENGEIENNEPKQIPNWTQQVLIQFPYYAEFYKKILEEYNLKSEFSSQYINKYLLYSKLNPDNEFLKTYLYAKEKTK
jgi:hypothetical protein